MNGLCQFLGALSLLTLMVTVLESEATDEQRSIHRLSKRGGNGVSQRLDENQTTPKSTADEVTEDPDYEFLGAIRKRFSRSSPPPSPESNEYFGKRDKRDGRSGKGDAKKNQFGGGMPAEDPGEWGEMFGGGNEGKKQKSKPKKAENVEEEDAERDRRRASSEEYWHHRGGGHHGGHRGHHSRRTRHRSGHDDSHSQESHSRESSSEEGSRSHESYHHRK